MEANRVAYVDVSGQVLLLALTGTVSGIPGIPADAQMVDVTWDNWRHSARLLIRSSKFAPVAELAAPPRAELSLSRV